MKVCSECKLTKPLEEFYKDRNKRDGLNVYCKPCARARAKRFKMRPPRIPAPEGMKRCVICKTTKLLDEFHNSKQTFDGKDDRCKQCAYELHKAWRAKNLEKAADNGRRWRAENPERARDHDRKKAHGVPLGWYNATLALQEGKCAICNSPEAGGRGDFHVDHCHSSGAIRGLLCHHCNLMIGNAKDNVETLNSAIAYLLKHKQST